MGEISRQLVCSNSAGIRKTFYRGASVAPYGRGIYGIFTRQVGRYRIRRSAGVNSTLIAPRDCGLKRARNRARGAGRHSNRGSRRLGGHILQYSAYVRWGGASNERTRGRAARDAIRVQIKSFADYTSSSNLIHAGVLNRAGGKDNKWIRGVPRIDIRNEPRLHASRLRRDRARAEEAPPEGA